MDVKRSEGTERGGKGGEDMIGEVRIGEDRVG